MLSFLQFIKESRDSTANPIMGWEESDTDSVLAKSTEQILKGREAN